MKKNLFINIALYFLTSIGVQAQISIAPTNLFIEDNNKFGTYMVINSSNQAHEISIEFFFGYSNTDSEGVQRRIVNDTTLAQNHSIAEYVRAFPQNFTIAPGQRQVVRIRINAPNNLDDGTYWARIKTAAIPESPPVEIESNETVTARVGVTIEQITGLFYKVGNVSTGIEIENIRPQFAEKNVLDILTYFNRTGNSPFLGTITAFLLDNNNEPVLQRSITTSYYFDGTIKHIMDTSNIPTGEYTVRVQFETLRSDVSSSDLVQMEPVTATTTVTIP